MLGRLLRLLPSETLHGYEHPELVETIFRKTVVYQPTEPWPEMDGVGSVLDFGGACGKHFKDAKPHSPSVRWAVVETPTMVARAKELETDQLRFFDNIDKAASWLGQIELIHSNGAIQYTPDPLGIVRKLCSLKANQLLWYRLFLGDGEEVQISKLQDNGPGSLRTPFKKVAYSFKRIRERDFLEAHCGYRLFSRGSDWFKFSSESCAPELSRPQP